MEWSGYTWLMEERWGQIHPEKPTWWYDESAVEVDDAGYLHLKTHYNPKKFNNIQANYISEIGAGLVSCTSREFHWGTYEIEAKLPNGKYLWPAFWMWSWNTWPPEIDILEAYSNSRGNYFKWNPFAPWNVQTNVHYSNILTGLNKMLGGKRHWFTHKDPAKYFIKYRLEWSAKSLKFYYNGRLVRIVKDAVIMEQINSTEMNVIINNGLTKYLPGQDQTSDFIIKYFRYTPL
jgi:beta-glucanase (GH16 family)